jgi:hypothetical protein
MDSVVAASGRATVSLIAPGLQRLSWSPGTHIDHVDALSVLAASRIMSSDGPYAILVDMTTTVDVRSDARAAFNAESLVVAAALLGDGPMDEVLAAAACRAVHPTRYFTSVSLALTWLEERLADRQIPSGDPSFR